MCGHSWNVAIPHNVTLMCTVAFHAGQRLKFACISCLWYVKRTEIIIIKISYNRVSDLADSVSLVTEYINIYIYISFYKSMLIIMSFYTKLYELWEKSNATCKLHNLCSISSVWVLIFQRSWRYAFLCIPFFSVAKLLSFGRKPLKQYD